EAPDEGHLAENLHPALRGATLSKGRATHIYIMDKLKSTPHKRRRPVLPELPDPSQILREAESMRSFIVDLTLRICRERTVDYFVQDFPGGGPDGMASPGEEGKVVSILQKELAAHSISVTTHAKVPG